MKRAIEYAGGALLGLAMLLGLAVLVGPHLGWQIDKVLSGSMSPAIQVGSAVISKPVDPASIEPGDIITFRSPVSGQLTTHRVVDITAGGTLLFQTKGDANEDPDPYLVAADGVVGKVRLHIPWVGYPAGFAKTPLGFVLLIGIPGLIIILLEIRDVWIHLSEEERKKKAGTGAGAVAVEAISSKAAAVVAGGEE